MYFIIIRMSNHKMSLFLKIVIFVLFILGIVIFNKLTFKPLVEGHGGGGGGGRNGGFGGRGFTGGLGGRSFGERVGRGIGYGALGYGGYRGYYFGYGDNDGYYDYYPPVYGEYSYDVY
jgi:hypothetical protein